MVPRFSRFTALLLIMSFFLSPVYGASEFILKGDNGEDFTISVDDPSGDTNGSITFGPTGSTQFKFFRKATNATDNPAVGVDYLCTFDGVTCVSVASLGTLLGSNVTQVTAGNGITVDQNTGNVTVTANYDNSTIGLNGGNSKLEIKSNSLEYAKFADSTILTSVEDDDTTGGGSIDDLIEAGGTISDSVIPTAKAVEEYFSTYLDQQIDAIDELVDADGDTKVQVEATPDDDTVRLTASNQEVFRMTSDVLIIGNMTGNARGTKAIDMQYERTSADDVASGNNSFIAGGGDNTASGQYSFATGKGNTASGDYSYVEGHLNTASGEGSHAEGGSTTASGINAHSQGYNTTASGDYSHAQGKDAVASGKASYAAGEGNTAKSFGESVIGLFADTSYTLGTNGATTFNAADRIFVVGNGTADGSRSNALEIQKSGDALVGGTWTWASGEDVCISGDVCLSQAQTSGDNLGNHIATEDLQMTDFDINLGGGYVSNDGDEEGLYVDNDGTVRTTGNMVVGGEVTSSSDIRLKENIQPLEGVSDKVMQLRGVTYEWKDPSRGEGEKIGFIAQEVETVYPQLVHQQGEYKSVNYAGMVVPLTEFLQDLHQENQTLEEQLTSLEDRLAALEK